MACRKQADTAVTERLGRKVGYAAASALEGLRAPATELRYSGPIVSGAVTTTCMLVAIFQFGGRRFAGGGRRTTLENHEKVLEEFVLKYCFRFEVLVDEN